jgi:hypothetical protein
VHLVGKMTTTVPRHFTVRHPLFQQKESKSGIWWEKSVYYLWWEFLRRHDGYKETCENGGNGKYAELYADFGNVHEGTFKEWWTKDGRGARLFAEPPMPNSIAALTSQEIEALPDDWDARSLLIVAIPLNLPKRFIQQRLSKLLTRHHTRKRGQRTFKESRALYRIAAQFNVHSLKKMLDLYDLEQLQPDMRQWQIGQQLSLGATLTEDELNGGRGTKNPAAVAKKNVLAVAANKKLKHAKSVIEGVGRGVFPTFAKGT